MNIEHFKEKYQLLQFPPAKMYMRWWRPLWSAINYGRYAHFQEDDTKIFKSKLKKLLGNQNLELVAQARVALYFILKDIKITQDDHMVISPISIPDMLSVPQKYTSDLSFYDIRNEDYFAYFDNIKDLIRDNTKVVFLTILYGLYPGELKKIYEFCHEREIVVILDATQALGMKDIDEISDFQIYSLCNFKDLHTHLGAIITSKHSLDGLIRKYNNQAQLLSASYLFKYLLEDFITMNILFFLKFRLIRKIAFFFKNAVFRKLKYIFGGDFKVKEFLPQKMIFQYNDLLSRIGIDHLKNLENNLIKRQENSKLFYKYFKEGLPTFNEKSTYWRLPINISFVTNTDERILLENELNLSKSGLSYLSKDNSMMAYEIFKDTRMLPNYLKD